MLVLPRADLVAQTVYWLLKEEHDAKPGAVPMIPFDALSHDVQQQYRDLVERVYRAIDRCTVQSVDVEHLRTLTP